MANELLARGNSGVSESEDFYQIINPLPSKNIQEPKITETIILIPESQNEEKKTPEIYSKKFSRVNVSENLNLGCDFIEMNGFDQKFRSKILF